MSSEKIKKIIYSLNLLGIKYDQINFDRMNQEIIVDIEYIVRKMHDKLKQFIDKMFDEQQLLKNELKMSGFADNFNQLDNQYLYQYDYQNQQLKLSKDSNGVFDQNQIQDSLKNTKNEWEKIKQTEIDEKEESYEKNIAVKWLKEQNNYNYMNFYKKYSKYNYSSQSIVQDSTLRKIFNKIYKYDKLADYYPKVCPFTKESFIIIEDPNHDLYSQINFNSKNKIYNYDQFNQFKKYNKQLYKLKEEETKLLEIKQKTIDKKKSISDSILSHRPNIKVCNFKYHFEQPQSIQVNPLLNFIIKEKDGLYDFNLELVGRIKQLKIKNIYGNIIEFINEDSTSLQLDIGNMNKISFLSKKKDIVQFYLRKYYKQKQIVDNYSKVNSESSALVIVFYNSQQSAMNKIKVDLRGWFLVDVSDEWLLIASESKSQQEYILFKNTGKNDQFKVEDAHQRLKSPLHNKSQSLLKDDNTIIFWHQGQYESRLQLANQSINKGNIVSSTIENVSAYQINKSVCIFQQGNKVKMASIDNKQESIILEGVLYKIVSLRLFGQILVIKSEENQYVFLEIILPIDD